jgi:hypothetical protein
MTKQETNKIIALIKSLYPYFLRDLEKDESEDQAEKLEVIRDTWHTVLEDIPYELATIAIQRHVCTENGKFAPSLHDIRSNSMVTVQGEQTTGGQAWNKLIRKIGAYGVNHGGTEKIKNDVDDITNKIIDGQLKLIGMMNQEDIGYMKHDFIKQYEEYSKREKENKLLPESLRNQIEQIAAQNDLNKQLEGNNTKVLKLERAKPKPKQISNKKFDFGKQKSQVKSIQNIISSMGNTAKK